MCPRLREVEVRKRDCPAEGWITVQLRTPPLARGRELGEFFLALKRAFWVWKKK